MSVTSLKASSLASNALLLWFLLVALAACFGTPLLSWELALGKASAPSVLLGLGIASAGVLSVRKWRGQVCDALTRQAWRATRVSTRCWLTWCLVIGLLIRIVWVSAFPAPQTSDERTYFGLAAALAAGRPYATQYEGHTWNSYWPPGYPLFLQLFLRVLGLDRWVLVLANLVLFATCMVVVHRLAVCAAGQAVARLSTAALTVWPNHVCLSGLASKELLLVMLVPLVVLLYLRTTLCSTRKAISRLLLSGAICGVASLTQPGLLFLPAIFALDGLIRRATIRELGLRLAMVTLGMAVVILPWSLRNRRVLGTWVLISTNGGSVFYRANNPLATGGYTPRGERSLALLNEAEQSRFGFKWGLEWIRANPGAFLKLAPRKQMLLLGDDAVGIYSTLKQGLGIAGIGYASWKAVANGFWWLIWLAVLAGCGGAWKQGSVARPEVLLMMSVVLYIVIVHCVFESAGKYHVPAIGIIAILAAQSVMREPRRDPSCLPGGVYHVLGGSQQ